MNKLYWLLFLSCLVSFGQKEYPKNDFINPLDIPLVLAGNFGELRSNHYHSGIDIKTQQREGLKVYSVADGYVSRIKISHYGYGKALYITHPNGYTTVYGHLTKFGKDIEAYIKEKQYQDESYEIELFPKFDELKVSQGDVVAFSGNTGGSGGPHLHFEVRDSETEHIINPLFFGIDIKDSQAPVLQGLVGYTLGWNAQINGKQGTYQLNYTQQNNGVFLADPITASGYISFGFKGFDRQDGAYNHNGIYAVDVLVNGSPYVKLDFETFSFAESRQINTYIDYAKFAGSGQRYQKCYLDSGNHLSIYSHQVNDGKILIEPGKNYNITINLKDFEDNITSIHIPVKGKDHAVTNAPEMEKTNYYLMANRDNFYEIGNASIYFPANTFYKNFYIDLKSDEDALYVHNRETPAADYFSINFDISDMKDDPHLDQYFIASYNYRGNPMYEPTRLKGTSMSTRTRSLGTYKILRDSTPPVVKAQNFKDNQWLSNYNYLLFTISDDLSGIKSYKATIDGKWILTEYEYKNNTLTFNCNDLKFEGSKHKLELTVTDNVGNSTTFTSTFFRKY
ncbi:Peptidase family M23 [Pustulibacterium marinum]|uniref:Peptidase family M23 n=1 Tax=Pustulibacterium marinum TaxID=1224947 RepID=A0A1I7IUU9_9FLAO|nr:M23 family metallopeptidase [Pustulibacterium marinum]SFU76668.1 Peptidase family M23 [Pustulibacterium marinum]